MSGHYLPHEQPQSHQPHPHQQQQQPHAQNDIDYRQSPQYHPNPLQHSTNGSAEASGSRQPSALGAPRKTGRGVSSEDANSRDAKPGKEPKEPKGGASEFVKKLYRMLEDQTFAEIVCWGYTGDSFVVKDMNSFTRSILPLHFKHSNFASFVRQLNKYDFHKVKNNTEDGSHPYGEHSWEFKHPSFRSDSKSSLEHIKRKPPAPRKGTPVPVRPAGPSESAGPEMIALQNQVEHISRSQTAMSQHMHTLSQEYQTVMGEMMNFQRNMVAQDQLMQNLIQYLVNLEADQKAAADTSSEATSPFVPSSQAQKLISSYTEVSRASYDQMADLSRRASLTGGPQIPLPPAGFGHIEGLPGGMMMERDERQAIGSAGSAGGSERERDIKPMPDTQGEYSRPESAARERYDPVDELRHREQQLYPPYPPQQQQQHLQQQSHSSQQHHQPPQHLQSHPTHSPSSHLLNSQLNVEERSISASPDASRPFAGARKPAYVPGWTVPPRVLLVEDDAVCRKLSSKFLQIFGCEIDVAVDGVSAVNKMNHQKYDLVLMDIVMPNLDGVSATSLIRQFDPMTPIISMTSNSGPNEIMTYFSHGMNDILPKPFSKESLLGMLEKHLIHLKVIQQMAEIPRALGFTDNQIQDAVADSTVGEAGFVENPFSAMGISDSDYVEMLQGIALEKEGKRGLEVVQGDEREGKRLRFQEVGEAH